MEQETVDTLQKVINKRAADRLNADLIALSTAIQSSPLMAETDRAFPYLTFNMYKGKGEESPRKDTKAPYWVFQYVLSGKSIARDVQLINENTGSL